MPQFINAMDILIESTQGFEQAMGELNPHEQKMVVEQIDNFTAQFATHRNHAYRKLKRLPISYLNCYESTLYHLRISNQFRVILTIDEDPVFNQIIFTLFRLGRRDEIDKALSSIAESLYQEFLHTQPKTA